MPSLADNIRTAIAFCTQDIWRLRLATLPRRKALFIRQLRIILLTAKRFVADKCQLKASALTFFSLLSIVPVVAMAFGIAKGFGFEKRLEKTLFERFPGQEEVIIKVVDFAQAMLENTKGGLIAGIGIVLLFWAVIKVLGNIENSFNDIWGVQKARTIGRKFSDYLAIMLISPVLMVLSSSATVFITTQITRITERIELIGLFSPVIFFFLKFAPYVLIWILFTFLYVVMPNTRVKLYSGVVAGIVAGTTYQLAQFAYITFQIGIARNNTIYGSFAALPLFMIWLQVSWLIVLFGAELCCAHQTIDSHEFGPDSQNVSYRFKQLLALRIMHRMIGQFAAGDPPPTAQALSEKLKIPIRLTNRILEEFVDSGKVSAVRGRNRRDIAYQPAQDIDRYTIQFTLDALANRGVKDIPVAQSDTLAELNAALSEFDRQVTHSSENKLLRQI